MANIGKIRIGRKSKKNFFDLTHDVNTTSDFGFCQPTMIDLVQPGSNVKLNTKQFLRLAPLPTPTFGRVKVHTDTSFVPVKSVMPAFDNFISHTAVNSRRSYIPETVDYFDKEILLTSLMAMSNYYGKTGQFDKCPFRYAVIARMQLSGDEDISTLPYRDLINDTSVIGSVARQCTAYHVIETLCKDASYNMFDKIWDGNIYSSDFNPSYYSIYGTRSQSINYNAPNINNFIANVPGRYYHQRAGSTGTFPSYSTNFGSIGSYIGLGVSVSTETRAAGEFTNGHEIDVPITLDNADYIFEVPYNSENFYLYDDNEDATTNTSRYTGKMYFCLKMTRFGRRIMRIFNAARQNVLGTYKGTYSMLPILSYYKAWFDIYNPGRTQNWELTPAFWLIHNFYDFGQPLYNCFGNDLNYMYSHADLRENWFKFLLDLGNCVYVLPIDNVTVCTENAVENLQSDTYETKFATNNNDNIGVLVDDDHPYGDPERESVFTLGGLGIKVLERLYAWTDKNSVTGQKIEEICKRYNIRLPKETFVNRDSYMCDISDIFSTSETSEGYLGEYAGRGTGSGRCSFSLQDTKDYGFIVQTLAIAPHSSYVQGENRQQIRRMDFYNPMYDSLGNEVVGMSEVLSRSYILSDSQSDTTFGFRPRFFGFKVRNNLANGYFAERGSMAQYLPYSLDRLFTVPDKVLSSDGLSVNGVTGLVPAATESLRFVGLDESIGNYDRIFYDNTGLVDNFIIHIVQDYKLWSPMKPVADSFDTYDKDVDDDTFEAERV